MAANKKNKPKKKEEKPIDFSDDNDIEARAENEGNMQCEWCFQDYYITEGYDDQYCSRECYESAI